MFPHHAAQGKPRETEPSTAGLNLHRSHTLFPRSPVSSQKVHKGPEAPAGAPLPLSEDETPKTPLPFCHSPSDLCTTKAMPNASP